VKILYKRRFILTSRKVSTASLNCLDVEQPHELLNQRVNFSIYTTTKKIWFRNWKFI